MRRRWWLFPLIAGGLLLAAAAWHDLSVSRGELVAARSSLARAVRDPGALRTVDGRRTAHVWIRDASERTSRADRRLERSIALRLAALVPGLSRQRSGAVQLAADADAGARAGERLIAAVDRLAEQTMVRDGALPLDGIRQLEGEVGRAADALRPLHRSTRGLWGQLGDARREFDAVVGSTTTRLDGASDSLRAATTFMGSDGTRRYLIAVQNNAEMRDQGMVLSYAVARFEGGRLDVEQTGDIGQLALDRPAPIEVPAGTQKIFGVFGPSEYWQSVNGTADFAWSGRAMAAMYQQATGQTIDGVVAVDVPAIAALLEAVGPVDVEGLPVTLTSQNAGDVLLKRLYDGIPVTDLRRFRKERLGDVAGAVVDQLTEGTHDAVALGRSLGDAAAGGHLRLWSRVADEERVFERSGLGGGPATKQADRTFHVAFQNATGAKLDYYVRTKTKLDVTLTEANTAVVRATVTARNTAPNGPPSYQLGPDRVLQKEPGEYFSNVYFWGPKGGQQPGGVLESNLLLSWDIMRVPAGKEGSLTFQTVIPNAVRDGRLELRFVPQPRLHPPELTVSLKAPGWRVDGAMTVTPRWDRTTTVGWGVRK